MYFSKLNPADKTHPLFLFKFRARVVGLALSLIIGYISTWHFVALSQSLIFWGIIGLVVGYFAGLLKEIAFATNEK